MEIEVIIEIPKGTRNKYEADHETGAIWLDRLLFTSTRYPEDYGYVPLTLAEDGDPLDALVVSEFCSFPGCVIECRLLGAVIAEQKDKNGTIRNDRFFFAPVLSKQYAAIESIKELPGTELKEIEEFFVEYNKEEGKTFKLLEVASAKKALKLIKKAE